MLDQCEQAYRPSVTYLLDFRLTPSFVLCIFVCLLCRILWSEVHRARLGHVLMAVMQQLHGLHEHSPRLVPSCISHEFSFQEDILDMLSYCLKVALSLISSPRFRCMVSGSWMSGQVWPKRVLLVLITCYTSNYMKA